VSKQWDESAACEQTFLRGVSSKHSTVSFGFLQSSQFFIQVLIFVLKLRSESAVMLTVSVFLKPSQISSLVHRVVVTIPDACLNPHSIGPNSTVSFRVLFEELGPLENFVFVTFLALQSVCLFVNATLKRVSPKSVFFIGRFQFRIEKFGDVRGPPFTEECVLCIFVRVFSGAENHEILFLSQDIFPRGRVFRVLHKYAKHALFGERWTANITKFFDPKLETTNEKNRFRADPLECCINKETNALQCEECHKDEILKGTEFLKKYAK
jgi:hypothetical protein